MARVLENEEFSRKAISRIAEQRDPVVRAMFEGLLHCYSERQLVYVDETYCSDKIGYRCRGRSPRGMPAYDPQHLHHSQAFSVLPAYSVDGYLPHPLIKPGSVKKVDFIEWLMLSVLPQCQPFPTARSVIVMDNCATHDRVDIKELCAARSVRVLFLPPYSPDYNPIMKTFRLLKRWIRMNAELMPVYGEEGWQSKFEVFLNEACEHWSHGINHSNLFRSCHVPKNGYEDSAIEPQLL